MILSLIRVARGGAVGWGTALQAGSIPDVTKMFYCQSHVPGVDAVCHRNEYQEYFLVVKAAGALDWQPYHLYVPIVLKSGSLNHLELERHVQVLLCFAYHWWFNISLLMKSRRKFDT